MELVVVHFEPYVIGQTLQRSNWQGGNESPFQPLSLAIAPILITFWDLVKVFYQTFLPNVFGTGHSALGSALECFLCSFLTLFKFCFLGIAWPTW